MEAAYAQSVHKVLSNFNVDPTGGLSDAQVTKLRTKHGRNCMYPQSAPRWYAAHTRLAHR